MPVGGPAEHISRHFDPVAFGQAGFDADEFLRMRFGVEPSFFHYNLSRLPYDMRRSVRDQMFAAMGFEGVYQDFLDAGFDLTEMKTSPTDKPWARFRIGREEFLGGRATAEKLFYSLTSFQVDEGETGVWRYTPSGRLIRHERLAEAAEQINKPQMAARRLVFDIETSGLNPELANIWQVSARMVDPTGQELDAVNVLMRDELQDVGRFRGYSSFEDFIRGQRGQQFIDEAGGFAARADMADALKPFLRMAEEADVLVAQYATFDVEHLERALTRLPAYDSDQEFRHLADVFIRKTRNQLSDNRIMAAAMLGEIRVDPAAAEAAARLGGRATPFSMENILLQTSFLEDIEQRLGVGRDVIRTQLERGLHYADVDVFFETHLNTLLHRAAQGEDVLQFATLGDREMRGLISQAAAITPVTRLPHLGGRTPLEEAVLTTRTFDAPSTNRLIKSQLFENGLFSRWTSQFLTQGGRAAKGVVFGLGFEGIQRQAVEAGLPFAGLSAFERTLSTLLGETTAQAAGGRINAMRKLAGELVGVSMFQATPMGDAERVRAFAGGKIASLPMEMLQEAETKGFLKETAFNRALKERVPGALQGARMSVIDFQTPSGGMQRDLALVADMANDDINGLLRFIDNLKGDELHKYIPEHRVNEVVAALQNYGSTHGVQIGVMGGAGKASVNRAISLMEQFGLDTDTSPIRLRTMLFGMDEVPGHILASPVMLDSDLERHSPEILSEMQRLTRMQRQLIGETADTTSAAILAASKKMGGRLTPGHRAVRVAETVISRGPAGLAIAAAGLAGYYLGRRRGEQAEFDETFVQQEFEDPSFYQDYQREMFEPQVPIAQIQRRQDPLRTAGMVQGLDREKSKHHQMGPNKHGHLF